MKILLPVAITDTSYVGTNAGALLETDVPDTSYPQWVPGGRYALGQRYEYDGDVYECVRKHPRRNVTPDVDPQYWRKLTVGASHAEWVSGSAYEKGDTVYWSGSHRVYLALNSTSGDVEPAYDTVNWLDIGPMNSWAMFDQSGGTRTSWESPLQFTLQPGAVNAIAFLDLAGAASVQVQMYDGETLVYENTTDVGDSAILTSWYDYFFSPILPQEAFVLDDLPPYFDATIDVTITGNGDTVGVGTVAPGTIIDLGCVQYGAKIGIVDYSRKETDDFGATALVERTYSNTLDLTIFVENDRLDYVTQRLASVRATPAVYFEPDSYESLILYGIYRDWSLVIAYPTTSMLSISLEELA